MKKLFAVFFVMLAAGSFIFASGRQGGSSQENNTIPLRFMWWGGDERHAATLQVIENFMEKHANVTIDGEYGGDAGYLEKLSTQLYSGTAADLIQVGPGWMPDLVSRGDFFVDFNQHRDKIDLSGFDPEYLKNTCVYNNILTGLPSGVAGSTMLVNTTLTSQAGINILNPTWESLIEAGIALQAYNPEYYLINTDSYNISTYVLRPYILQLTGSPLLNNETRKMGFTREQLIQTLEYIKNLYDNRVFQPAAESAAFSRNTATSPKWINGSFASALCVSSTINTYTSANTNVSYDIAGMPMLPNRKNDAFYASPPQIMSIAKTVENNPDKLAACFAFYDYFFNDPGAAEILKDLRSVPPTTTARQVCDAKGLINSLVLKSVEIGLALNGTNEMGLTTAPEVEAICIDMIEKVAYNRASVAQIADEAIRLLSFYLDNL